MRSIQTLWALASLQNGVMSTPQRQLLQCLCEGAKLWPRTWVAQGGSLEESVQSPPAAVRPLEGGTLGDNPWVEGQVAAEGKDRALTSEGAAARPAQPQAGS